MTVVKPYTINIRNKSHTLKDVFDLGGRIKDGFSNRYDFKINSKEYPKLGEYEIYAMTVAKDTLATNIKINGTLKLLDDKSVQMEFSGSEFRQKGTSARMELRQHIVDALKAAKDGQDTPANSLAVPEKSPNPVEAS